MDGRGPDAEYLRTLRLAAMCHEAQVECLYWKQFAETATSGRAKPASSNALVRLRAELQQTLNDALVLKARIEAAERALVHPQRSAGKVEPDVTVRQPAPAARSDARLRAGTPTARAQGATDLAETKRVRIAAAPKRKPRVSIIIVADGDSAAAQMALESAVAQDYRATSVTVLDNGSYGATADMLARLDKGASGPSLVRASAQGDDSTNDDFLSEIGGDYVLIQTTGDILEPDAIEKLVTVALERGADVIGGGLRRRVADKDVIVPGYAENVSDVDFRRNRQKAFQYATLYDCCNKLFSSRFLKHNRLVMSPKVVARDVDLWLRSMFLLDRFTQIDRPVATRLDASVSLEWLKSSGAFDRSLQLVDDLIDFYDEKDLRKFAPMRNQALLGGVLRPLVKWKLEEFDGRSASPELAKLEAALHKIPEADFVNYYVRKSKGPMVAVMLLVRDGQFLPAKRVLQSADWAEYASLMGANSTPTRNDLIERALSFVAADVAPA